MRIDHIAVWTYNLEGLRNFYMHYFDASCGEIYYNHSREYRSYIMTFDGDCSIEIMEMPNVPKSKNNPLKEHSGIIHFAIKVGSKPEVNRITEMLRSDGFKVVGEPQTTGDGNYESLVLDPDGNRLEIVA
ncbi:MAG TPA: VOC family protein [Prolixibacteraceae bacterium]|nr:VOC family protein [Prolixibacteraceae bacterium]